MKCEKCKNYENPKPTWRLAPQWAQFLTQDKYGTWKWHENKPARCEELEWWESTGRTATYSGNEWKYTAERRPT